MTPALPPTETISQEEARQIMLAAQGGFRAFPQAQPPAAKPDVLRLIRQMGALQIDTIHVIARSPYLTLWSRLGDYNPAWLDELLAEGALFEYWAHAMCFLPVEDYPLYRRAMLERTGGWGDAAQWVAEHAGVVEQVLERIRREGALRSADFKNGNKPAGGWWNWKDEKTALECLLWLGELMIARRQNFQRVYDLRERVLPGWVDTSEPSADEEHRHHVARAARALGIGTAGHIADYAYMKRGPAAPFVADLVEGGELVEVDAETASGEVATLLVHRDLLPLVEPAADGALQAERTTFLSPFDSLFWPRNRDQLLWGFRQALEAYKPARDRIWGYFCLPILHRERLVGRFDPKLERGNGTLRVKALYLEPGIAPEEDLIAGVAGAMRDFMAWHNAADLVIERSTPDDFGAKLLAAL